MKKRRSLVYIAAAMAALAGANGADSQKAHAQLGPAGRLGTQVYEPDSFRRVAADVNVGLPGRLWVESSFADQGLGYNGSYLTVGGKRRLFEDFLDGRWLTEARLHHSIEDDGGFFANVGIERVFSIDAAKSDVVVGFWYDFDGDQQGNFGHDFSQVAVNAAIKTRRWDLVGNGYFPVGVRNYSSGDVTGTDFFFGNNILLQPGIDSALNGFDATLRMRPKQLAFMNGSFEIGGYGYNSELVNSFGGGRVGLGAQTRRGLSVNARINYDDRFDVTGVLSIGYTFGANGAINSEYGGLGRDLEQTLRNDHIVRFNQSVELALDPDTGAAYNVVHVRNTADGAVGDGSAETPFDNLREAQLTSSVGDIIFVDAGDGTTNNLDQGIILKNDQFLLSSGTDTIIPIQDGRLFRLETGDTAAATISNPGGFDVVRLADNNVVSGITVDAGGAQNGITANTRDRGTIQSTTIFGAGEFGVLASNVSGDWTFNNNTATGNGIDGIFINGSTDPTATFAFNGNTVTGNGFEGIHLDNFEAAQVSFNENITSTNGRHGLYIEDYLTGGGQVDIVSQVSTDNGGQGILLERGDGNLNILNSTVTGNIAGGVKTDTWTNLVAGQSTFIGNVGDGVTTISDNGVGAGANLQFDLFADGVTQDVLVTGLSLDNGGRGVFGTVSGQDSVMNIQIVNMVSISNNIADGIRLIASDGATINTRIANDAGLALQMIDNGSAAGAGIFLSADGVGVGTPSAINAVIDNVNIQIAPSAFSLRGIDVSSLGNAVVDIDVSNTAITKSEVAVEAIGEIRGGDIGIDLDFANNGRGDINSVFINTTSIQADNGISLTTSVNTLTDFAILESEIRPSGERAADDSRLDNTPFDGSVFGGLGISIQATGDISSVAADNLTRVSIEDVLVRDFAGSVFGGVFGGGFFNTFDGTGANTGSAVDIATFGDANMLLTFNNNEILNSGAGYNNDADNDNVFNDQAVVLTEDPDNLLFYDGVKVNAFDQSIVSASFVNNLFQDNFERGLGLNTFNSATINASLVNNVFDGNDRGEDGDNQTVNNNPDLEADFNAIDLLDSDIFDFEAINNEEFNLRPHELLLVADGDGDPIDLDEDDIADATIFDGLAPGFANMCIGMSNNVFALSVDIADFSQAPGDLQLGLDGATNGFTGAPFPFFRSFFAPQPDAATLTNFNVCSQLIANEELFFEGNGFAAPEH